uniref:Uncharacterized protein n=1 Tax=Cucumis melo TaxID=3656 RepID=A0A9I9E5F7_CUCME
MLRLPTQLSNIHLAKKSTWNQELRIQICVDMFVLKTFVGNVSKKFRDLNILKFLCQLLRNFAPYTYLQWISISLTFSKVQIVFCTYAVEYFM